MEICYTSRALLQKTRWRVQVFSCSKAASRSPGRLLQGILLLLVLMACPPHTPRCCRFAAMLTYERLAFCCGHKRFVSRASYEISRTMKFSRSRQTKQY